MMYMDLDDLIQMPKQNVRAPSGPALSNQALSNNLYTPGGPAFNPSILARAPHYQSSNPSILARAPNPSH